MYIESQFLSTMKKSTLKKVLTTFGVIAIILTIMPFIALDYWWIRMFDFPHLQLTFLTAVAILVYFIKFDFKNKKDYAFLSVLVVCLLFQFTKIYPYTAFADYEVLNAESENQSLSIYTANVLQKNTNHSSLLSQVNQYDADIILFTETDKIWKNSIKQAIKSDYNYGVEVPKDNTYGMLFYSKFEMLDTKVKYLVSDSIPSVHTKIKLPSGDVIQIYAIHPTPPMPQENPLSTDRDAEMMMIAKLALDSEYPVIVIGDFNDVAWSETSLLFQNVSRLLDVRKGRGLYNTYNADSFLLRWPLDHIFISSDFKLKHIERCDDIDSDHFPLMTKLSYEPNSKSQQQRRLPTEEELKRAQDQIDKFIESLSDKK